MLGAHDVGFGFPGNVWMSIGFGSVHVPCASVTKSAQRLQFRQTLSEVFLQHSRLRTRSSAHEKRRFGRLERTGRSRLRKVRQRLFRREAVAMEEEDRSGLLLPSEHLARNASFLQDASADRSAAVTRDAPRRHLRLVADSVQVCRPKTTKKRLFRQAYAKDGSSVEQTVPVLKLVQTGIDVTLIAASTCR